MMLYDAFLNYLQKSPSLKVAYLKKKLQAYHFDRTC